MSDNLWRSAQESWQALVPEAQVGLRAAGVFAITLVAARAAGWLVGRRLRAIHFDAAFRRPWAPTPTGGRSDTANPDSTVLRHGGLFQENVLLDGEVRTAYKTPVAQRLQRAFDAAIRKHFVMIQAFYVGLAAEALLDSGCRLTAAEQCPPEVDLRR